MKKASICFFVIACLWLAFGYSVKAATNPFAENDVQIQQSGLAYGSGDEKAVVSTENQVVKADLDKAIKKLEEANKNYSKLLRKFADDPSKFADENGDYRGFIRQLEELSKRLSELSDRLKKISAGLEKKDEKEDKKPAKIVQGTVKVSTSLNIRTSPWGTIIGSFYNNDRVKITGQKGDWYKIDYNGKTAYIHANYVATPTRPAGKTPVKQPSSSISNTKVASTGGKWGTAPCQPMPGRSSSEFGWRKHPTLGTRKLHNGIDLPVPNGTRLNALGNGVVTAVGYESGGGKYVKVKYDNGYESFYCHLQGTSVKKGQRVSAGREIARSDNTGQWTTGPHLHFGLKKNGKYINPRSAGIPLP